MRRSELPLRLKKIDAFNEKDRYTRQEVQKRYEEAKKDYLDRKKKPIISNFPMKGGKRKRKTKKK